MKTSKFNFKRIINEELREGKKVSASNSLNTILKTLDECIDSMELELIDMELVESTNKNIPAIKECINFMHNTRNKLKKL